MRIALVYNAKGSLPPDARLAADGELTEEELFAECDSPKTIDAVARAIRSGGHDVTPLDATRDVYEQLRRGRFELVFNLAEGVIGEAREAQVPAMLEFLGIPYTGSDPITLAIAHHKARAKDVWRARGVAVPDGVTVPLGDAVPRALPRARAWIVKPVAEGSSKGVRDSNLVRTRAEVAARVAEVHRRFRQAALVEEFLEGREFTVALLGNGASLRVLPIVEIDFSSLPAGAKPIYSYEAKWIWDRTDAPLEIFSCPAKTSATLRRRLSAIAVDAFRALGCRDWSRVDLRLGADGRPRVIEINPLPGVLPDPDENSCFPKAARAAGLTFDQAILAVIDAAVGRLGLAAPRHARKAAAR